MDPDEWRKQRDDRSLRYAGRTLSDGPAVAISGELEYLSTYSGQVAAITTASLLGRMSTSSLKLSLPDVQVLASLPWAGANLKDLIMDQLRAADPYADFRAADQSAGDYVIALGAKGNGRWVHSSGWEAFVGFGESPISCKEDANPVGGALAACIAVGEVYPNHFKQPDDSIYLDAFHWTHDVQQVKGPDIAPDLPLGELWTIGTGSVGTAIAYFLTLATRDYRSRLFDMDYVKIHNLDRSPIFIDADVGKKKAIVTRDFLTGLGVKNVTAEDVSLDQTQTYRDRTIGVPDLLVSAANERNVRSIIESHYPPLQIYGTTGKNWQATMLRHKPFSDPCSCCIFPPAEEFTPTQCATGKVATEKGEQVDAALPFLSYAAGAMAAADIFKAAL